MAVPTTSNPSNGTVAAGTDTLVISHTSESSKTIYAIIAATTLSAFSGEEDFATPTDFDGVAMNRKASWFSAGLSNIDRFWVYTLTGQAAKTANFTFDGSALAAAGWVGISAILFNVADGPINGDIILPGGFAKLTGATSQAKKALSWDSGGLQICAGWGGLAAASLAITEGSNIDSVSGLTVNSQSSNNSTRTFTLTRGVSGKLTLFSFLIPPGSTSLSGGNFQPWFTGSIPIASMAVGDFAYTGLPYANALSNVGNPGFVRQSDILPIPGTIRSFIVNANESPGVGNTIRISLALGGYDGSTGDEGVAYAIDTGISVDLTNSNWEDGVSLDGVDFPFYRYQQLNLRVEYLSGSGTIGGTLELGASLIVEAGIDNEQLYGGGILQFPGGALDGEALLGILHPSTNVWTTFPTMQKSLVRIEVEVTELVATYQRATALNPDHQYYLEVTRWNGLSYDAPQLQDGTGGSVDTEATLETNTMNRAYARSTFSLTLNPKDLVSAVAILRDGSSSQLRSGVVIKAKPTVPGAFMVSGAANYTGTFDFVARINSAVSDWSATTANEAKYSLIIPPLTALGNPLVFGGETVLVEPAGPEGGASFTPTFRKDLVNTAITLTISGSTILAEMNADVSVVENDKLTSFWDGNNFPNARREFWSYPGLALAPDTGVIIVQKDAGGNTSAVFGFTASGGLSPGSFNLSGGDQEVFSGIAAGSGYGFAETPPAGWQQESVTVSNGSPVSNITVAEGETVTVIFVNSLIAPANNASGMYEMIPNKTSDTIWIDIAMGVSEDRKIP